MAEQTDSRKGGSYTRRVLIAAAVVTAVAILIFLVWRLFHTLLVVTAGILLGISLSGISGWLSKRTPLSHRAALALTVLVLTVLMIALVLFSAPSLVEQANLLRTSLMASIEELRSNLSAGEWGRPILQRLPNLSQLFAAPLDLISRVSTVFSGTISILSNIALVVFLGFFLAWEPDLYVNGLLRLLPRSRRRRMGEVFDELAYTLRWWLVGRLGSMLIVGLASVIGLSLLGIPLALIMGVLAGILAFIPILGPSLALIPPLLIAFTIGPRMALYVLLLYGGIQVVESYFLTPVIQREAVSLPPGLLILAQVSLGLVGGLIGLAMAPPLAAAGMVLVKMLYVEDVLHDDAVSLLKDDPEPRFAASHADEEATAVSPPSS